MDLRFKATGRTIMTPTKLADGRETMKDEVFEMCSCKGERPF